MKKIISMVLCLLLCLNTPVLATEGISAAQMQEETQNLTSLESWTESEMEGSIPIETVSEEPTLTETVPTEPTLTEAVPTEPALTEVVPTEPALTETMSTEPVLTEAVSTEPASMEVSQTEPVETTQTATEMEPTSEAGAELSSDASSLTDPVESTSEAGVLEEETLEKTSLEEERTTEEILKTETIEEETTEEILEEETTEEIAEEETTEEILETEIEEEETTEEPVLEEAVIEEVSADKDTSPYIVDCFGDSHTQWLYEDKIIPYTRILQSYLGGVWSVRNYGVPSEAPKEILVRMGALECVIDPVVVPKDGSKVLCHLYLKDSGLQMNCVGIRNASGLNYVKIDKNYYTITSDGVDTYISAATVAVSDYVISSRQTVTVHYAQQTTRSSVLVLLMGTNMRLNDLTSIDDLVALNQIAASLYQRYIIVSEPYRYTGAEREEYNRKMSAAFGSHYLDSRTYIIEHGLSDQGITPTKQDLKAIEEGRTPPSLLENTKHYNTMGLELLAKCVYQKGIELGYWGGDRGISLNKNYLSLARGASEELQLDCSGITGRSNAVTWTSSNPDIVSVENGVVTAVGYGYATVTASYNGYEAFCTVDVKGYLDGLQVQSMENYGMNYIRVWWYPSSSSEQLTYWLYRSEDAKSYQVVSKKVAYSSSSDLYYAYDTNVESGKTYYYYVMGYKLDADGTIIKTMIAYNIEHIMALHAPYPAVSVESESSCRVSWQPVAGAESYLIYRRTEESGWKKIGTASGGYATSFLDEKAAKGQTYYYTVRAESSSQKVLSGFLMNGVKVTLPVNSLSTPKMTGARVEGSSILIDWNAVDAAQSYYVYRMSIREGFWRYLGETVDCMYKDDGPVSGETYYYAVRAVCYTNGTRLMSSFETLKASLGISAPVLNKSEVVISGDNVFFSWQAAENADAYQVYYRTSNTAEWIRYVNLQGNVLKYSMKISRALMSCQIAVCAVQKQTDGWLYSDLSKCSFTAERMSQVTSTNAAAYKGGYIYVTWDAVKDAANYMVFRRTLNGGWVCVKVTGSTGYLDRNCASGVSYEYVIRANAASKLLSPYAGSGYPSAKALGTPELGTVTFAKNALSVTWHGVEGAEGYLIYRKTETGKWQTLGETAGDVYQYQDTHAATGLVYYYTVRGFCTVNGQRQLSDYSRSLISGIALDTPQMGGTVRSEKTIRVSWKPVTGAQGYFIYRRESNGGWTRLTWVNAPETEYTDNQTDSQTAYYYTVRAFCMTGGIRFLSGYEFPGAYSAEDEG